MSNFGSAGAGALDATVSTREEDRPVEDAEVVRPKDVDDEEWEAALASGRLSGGLVEPEAPTPAVDPEVADAATKWKDRVGHTPFRPDNVDDEEWAAALASGRVNPVTYESE